LNLGIKVGDHPENIRANRRKFCEAVGVEQEKVVASGQVHGHHVAVVEAAQAGQRLADTDGLVTRTQGLPLLLFFADCVPLLLFDPVRRVIGLSHAGWKGTFQSIGPGTLDIMQQSFGTDPADCIVGIGPSIGPDDYEVDKPVFEVIRRKWPAPEQFSKPGRPGHWMLNLWEWNRQQLTAAGVQPENIVISDISTARQPDVFFSHRASGGTAGRFGVLAEL
jgi:YfiH family protein